MPNIGPAEIGIILILCLFVFGPKRLPELGRSLGSGLRGFKESLTGAGDDADAGDRPSALATAAGPEAMSKRSTDARALSHHASGASHNV